MSVMTTPGELTGDYVLDTDRTRIGFVARHTMGPRVRGQFEDFEGDVHLDGGHPSQSGARLTIKAGSIQTRNRRRDEYLRDTFLGVADHVALFFTSTNVQQTDETGFTVTGDLTIRGATKSVAVDFELTGAEHDPQGHFRVSFQGRTVINRHDWGVNWNAATTAMVSAKVTLELDVVAVRQP